MSPEPSDASFDTDQWVESVVKAATSVDLVAPGAGNADAVVNFKLGRSTSAVIAIEAGRITGARDVADATVTIPVTAEQLSQYCRGSQSMSRDYMRGDLKPVGPTGHFIALIDIFENPDFVAALTDKL